MENRWRRLTVVAVATLAFTACATTRALVGGGSQTWSLTASARVPAADGFVRVAVGKDGNQGVDVEVHHLAHPAKVFPGAMHYVVWLIPQGSGNGNGVPQNLGVLPLDEDLTARLTTKTPFRAFDVLVTAEAASNVTQPSGNRVLSAPIRIGG